MTMVVPGSTPTLLQKIDGSDPQQQQAATAHRGGVGREHYLHVPGEKNEWLWGGSASASARKVLCKSAR
jgi:hypothetical protein